MRTAPRRPVTPPGAREAGDRRFSRRLEDLLTAGEPLERMRLLFLLFSAVVAAQAAGLVAVSTAPAAARAGVLALLAALVARWWRAYRTGRLPALGDPLEALVVLLAGCVGGPWKVLGLLYVGLYYRSLYGSLARVVAGGALFGAAHVGAALIAGTPSYGLAGALPHVPLLLLTAGVTGLLADRLVDWQRRLERETAMRQASAALVAAPDSASIHAATLEFALRLAGGAPARAALALGSPERLTVAAVAGAGGHHPTHPRAGDRLSERELARALSGAEAGVGGGEVAISRLEAKGRPLGALVIASEAPLVEEARNALAALAGQAGLALEVSSRAERRGEERFRALVENASEVITVVDPSYLTVTYQSPSAGPVLGYGPHELVGSRLTDLVHPEDGERARALVAAATADPDAAGAPEELRLRRRSGGWIEAETVARNLVRDENVQGIVLTSRDVRERKRAEAALRESEQRYRTIVETASEGIWTIDARDRTTFVNARMASMLGYPVEEMLGMTPYDFLDEERRPATEAALARRRDGVSERYETTFLHRDGHGVRVVLASTPLRGADGAYAGALAMVTDVTEQRRAEHERAELERRVHQSERLESVGQLAGGVAHDFNNLLAVILNYADFVRDSLEADSPVRDDVEEIRRAATRAADLTHQLLVFSRREIVRPTVQDLNAVVADTDKLLARTLGEDIELVTAVSEAPPIRADRGQLEQVLVNLAVNARDAMPEGGRLTIATGTARLDEGGRGRPGLPPGDYARLRVTDTGAGMDAAVAARAFEPFFTTKPTGSGTGLGLATVYGIVRQAGGDAEVRSEPGRGTTVELLIPACPEPEPDSGGADGAGAPRSAGGPVDGAAAARGRVLVVEDEDGVREVACRVLARAGYSVLAAREGEEALEVCLRDERPIDLVLTDVVMPRVSGKEFCERLRELRPGVATVYMSGYTDDVVLRHGVGDRSVAFVEKPFSAPELLRAVRDALEPEADGAGNGSETPPAAA